MLLLKNVQKYLHFSNIFCSDSGEMNRSQSCVPLGTRRNTYSAATMPPSQEVLLLVNVVINIDPPGCHNTTEFQIKPSSG